MASAERDTSQEWNFKANPFKVLGVSGQDITPEQLKKVYMADIKVQHTDKAGTEHLKKVQLMNAAWNFLKNKNAEELSQLATQFGCGGVVPGSRGRRQTNVLVDKTRSERYRRLFQETLQLASEDSVRFLDNFADFYQRVFKEVSVHPDVKPGYYCGVCEEEFIKEEHHVELVYDPYKTLLFEVAANQSGTLKQCMKEAFGSEVRDNHLFKYGAGFGDWTPTSFATSLNRWCNIMRKNESEILNADENLSGTFAESFEKNYGKNEASALCWLKSTGNMTPEEICENGYMIYPMNVDGVENENTKVYNVEFLFLAFLHIIKGDIDWLNLALKTASKTPRLALLLACAGKALLPDNVFIKQMLPALVGETIVKKCGDADHAHFCFLLGNCDLTLVAERLVTPPTNVEAIQLAAYYFKETRDVSGLEEGRRKCLADSLLDDAEKQKRVNFYTSFLFVYHATRADWDRAVYATDSFIELDKQWMIVSAMITAHRNLAELESVAHVTIYNILQKLEPEPLSPLAKLLGELGLDIKPVCRVTPTDINALVGALHILQGDQPRYEQAVKVATEALTGQLDNKLAEGDFEFILALCRVPNLEPVLKNVLEQKRFLGSNAIKTTPGSTYYTSLLLLRAIYHFKNQKFGEMTTDLISAATHTLDQKVYKSIGKFMASNPIIHEKILKLQSVQFHQLQAYVEDYDGEPYDEANFLQILQNVNTSEEPYLSKSFQVRKDPDDNSLDVNFLEQDILNKEEEDADNDTENSANVVTANSLAEIGYSYIDLEVICHSLPETVNCFTMAAKYFLKAMLVTQDENLAQKFAYRKLILECCDALKAFGYNFRLSPILGLHALRSCLAFQFRANQDFSHAICKSRPGSGFRFNSEKFLDQSGIPEQVVIWQMIISRRSVCPIIPTGICTIAEGQWTQLFANRLQTGLLREKVLGQKYSRNTPEALFQYQLFYGVWAHHIDPQSTGFEEPIPELPPLEEIDTEADNEEEKERKQKKNEEIERERQKIDDLLKLPLVERRGFLTAREIAMVSLAEFYDYDVADVETMMNWSYLRRLPNGFLDPTNRSLKISDGYSSFNGIRLDPNKKTCELLMEEGGYSEKYSKPAYFTGADLLEVFGLKIFAAELSFKEELIPTHVPPHLQQIFHHHPFNRVWYVGCGPEGASRELICGTNFLMTLYHLDLLAKMFTTGREVSANFPFEYCSTEDNLLKGLSQELQNILKPIPRQKKIKNMSELENVNRFWFAVEGTEQSITQGSQENGGVCTIKFGDVSVVLKTRKMRRGSNGELEDDETHFDENSPEAKFVRLFNAKMPVIEKANPIIRRVKELAKISQCAWLCHQNKELFGKHIPAFKDLMNLKVPPTRPYSNCGREGETCQCCNLVPAVYHQEKVSVQQKMEYLFEKFSMETPENMLEQGDGINNDPVEAKPSTSESGKRRGLLGFFFDTLFSDNSAKTEPAAEKAKAEEQEKKEAACDMKKYDRFEVYRSYGGVGFYPKSVDRSYIPLPSQASTSAGALYRFSLDANNNGFRRLQSTREAPRSQARSLVKQAQSRGTSGSVGGNMRGGRRGAGGSGGNGGDDGNGDDKKGKGPAGAPKVLWDERRATKIFGTRPGHVQDTKEHRDLFVKVANEGKYAITDDHGKVWRELRLPDGRQAWVAIWGNRIDNAGINGKDDIRTPNKQEGLSGKNYKKK